MVRQDRSHAGLLGQHTPSLSARICTNVNVNHFRVAAISRRTQTVISHPNSEGKVCFGITALAPNQNQVDHRTLSCGPSFGNQRKERRKCKNRAIWTIPFKMPRSKHHACYTRPGRALVSTQGLDAKAQQAVVKGQGAGMPRRDFGRVISWPSVQSKNVKLFSLSSDTYIISKKTTAPIDGTLILLVLLLAPGTMARHRNVFS